MVSSLYFINRKGRQDVASAQEQLQAHQAEAEKKESGANGFFCLISRVEEEAPAGFAAGPEAHQRRADDGSSAQPEPPRQKRRKEREMNEGVAFLA